MTDEQRYERLLRKLRNDPRLWEEGETGDRISRLIDKAKTRLSKVRRKMPKQVGPYSGLTKQELRASGTCETDWF